MMLKCWLYFFFSKSNVVMIMIRNIYIAPYLLNTLIYGCDVILKMCMPCARYKWYVMTSAAYIVQHLVSSCTSLWELNVQHIVPLHSRAVSYHSARVHDVTITLRCVLVWICAMLSRTEIVLWMKYVLRVGHALAIFSEEEEKEWNLTHPRYEILINHILFNLVNPLKTIWFCYNTHFP